MQKRMIFSIGTLLLGVFVYYLYYKQILINKNIAFILIRNYIPDALWTISFYSICAIFSKGLIKNYILFTAIYVIIIGILFEFLQFTGIVRGTFDIWDIITYIISSIVASLIEKKYWRN